MMNSIFDHLNKFDPSKTRFLVVPILAEMQNPALTDAQLDGKIRDAFEKTSHPYIPLEYAEIKIHCAMAMYSRERYYEAKILLEEALAKYESDPHRRVFTLWLMGINAYAMEDVSFAYGYWISARIILEDIVNGRRFPINKPEKLNWYQTRLKELNQLLATRCIQEIYKWYDYFEANYLDRQTVIFAEKILKAISVRKQFEANQLIDCLLRITEMGDSRYQTREVMVICGVAQYLLGDVQESINYFTDAIFKLEPKSHRQAVVYWLRGIAKWRTPKLKEEAIMDFKKAIILFKELRLKADKKHLTLQMSWYTEKLDFMDKEYAEKEKSLLNIFA